MVFPTYLCVLFGCTLQDKSVEQTYLVLPATPTATIIFSPDEDGPASVPDSPHRRQRRPHGERTKEKPMKQCSTSLPGSPTIRPSGMMLPTQANSAPCTRANSRESLVAIPKLDIEGAIRNRRPSRVDISSRRINSARTVPSSACTNPASLSIVVNSARTLKHLKQPACLLHAPEPVPALLHGTVALPGAPSLGDQLLGKLHVELQDLKNDPRELERVRTRMQNARQPLTQALRKQIKAKDERIRELEQQVNSARKAPFGDKMQPTCGDLASKWLGRARQRLVQEQEEPTADNPDTPPRTPVGERPFALSPATTGTAFLVQAFAEAKAAEAACEAPSAQQQSSSAQKLASQNTRASATSRSLSKREAAPHVAPASVPVTNALPPVRPGMAPRFKMRPSDRAAYEAAKAKDRAVSAAKAAAVATADAAAKAELAAQVKGCNTTELSAEAAWVVTKAPRVAAAAVKAANAAQQEADQAALASRCADLGALEHHENQNVRFFSRAPAQALISLATFVRDEQARTNRDDEAIGKPLSLSEPLSFTSQVTPVALAMPSSLRHTCAAHLDNASPGLVRSSA